VLWKPESLPSGAKPVGPGAKYKHPESRQMGRFGGISLPRTAQFLLIGDDNVLSLVWTARKQGTADDVCLRRLDAVRIAILAPMGSPRSAKPNWAPIAGSSIAKIFADFAKLL
jgi:hypothetical protein